MTAEVIKRISPKTRETEVKGYCPACKRATHKRWEQGSRRDGIQYEVDQHNRAFHGETE
jgi:hypothetical protein